VGTFCSKRSLHVVRTYVSRVTLAPSLLFDLTSSTPAFHYYSPHHVVDAAISTVYFAFARLHLTLARHSSLRDKGKKTLRAYNENNRSNIGSSRSCVLSDIDNLCIYSAVRRDESSCFWSVELSRRFGR
jgi:hypothetical protein